MRLSINNLSTSWLVALSIIALVSCSVKETGPNDNTSSEGDQVRVVTSIYPLTYFTEQIGGDQVSVTQMIKPGVESHDFEPAASDVRLIGDADVFVYSHQEFEGWALDLVESAGTSEIQVVSAAEIEMHSDVDQIEQEVHDENEDDEHENDRHGGHDHDYGSDPHVWLNPIEALGMVNRILNALIIADPESTTLYSSNADLLISEIEQLDADLLTQLDRCDHSAIVVSHLAFGHMAERYGFEQIGLAGLTPEFESGPAQIANVVDQINQLGIEYIMQEPIVSDRLAETVSVETGAKLLQLHPLEIRTLEEADDDLDYIEIMRQNGEALRTALRCK